MSNGRFVRVALALLLALLAASACLADVVTDWNTAMLEYIKGNAISNQFGNRAMAMAHAAMFDAVNGIERRYEPFLFRVPAVRSLPAGVAASAAACTVLSGLFPGDRLVFEVLYDSHLSQAANRGRALLAARYGELVGRAVLKWREKDGSAEAADVPFPDGTEIGEWRRTNPMMAPMFPGWGRVKPFAIRAQDQFRLIGPPALDGYEYARDYNEVKEMGAAGSATRTPEQTAIARFWPSGIPHLWNLVAREVSSRKDYGLLQNARLFALLNLALADAGIVGWNMKYHYGFWRPVHAIAYGEVDGNNGTAGDPAWTSLLPAPAFPEYVSGHSTTCAAAATVLRMYTGDDAFPFTLVSEANPSLPPRSFPGFWAAAREAGLSRVYGGIHFNFSNAEGLEAGRSLGRFICESRLTPLASGGR